MPKIEYDVKGDGNGKTVTNILKRVGVRKNLEEHLTNYYKEINTDASRPEMLAFENYRDANAHWILMLINNVVDPYYDWVLDPRALDEIIQKKYPNKVIQLPSNYYTGGGKLFQKGEKISDGSQEKTVLYFDADLRQITIDATPSYSDGATITGASSSASFTWNSNLLINERSAVHHYEKPDPNDSTKGSGIIVSSSYSGAVAIGNDEYETNKNEEKRNISIVSMGNVPTIEENYLEEIQK